MSRIRSVPLPCCEEVTIAVNSVKCVITHHILTSQKNCWISLQIYLALQETTALIHHSTAGECLLKQMICVTRLMLVDRASQCPLAVGESYPKQTLALTSSVFPSNVENLQVWVTHMQFVTNRLTHIKPQIIIL